MCIYRPEEIPDGARQNYRGPPAGGQRVAVAVAIICKEAERQYKDVAFLIQGLVGLALLIHDRPTTFVSGILATFNLVVLLNQWRLGAGDISRRPPHG